jgi:hypothetical protein
MVTSVVVSINGMLENVDKRRCIYEEFGNRQVGVEQLT